MFFMATQGVVQLVQRYRNGIRGHMKSVVQDLLRQYLRVELQFQNGQSLYFVILSDWLCWYFTESLLAAAHVPVNGLCRQEILWRKV